MSTAQQVWLPIAIAIGIPGLLFLGGLVVLLLTGRSCDPAATSDSVHDWLDHPDREDQR